MYDIIIVGAGPAGLTAALYARRANKSVLVLDKGTFGGQVTFSPLIENYPGYVSMSGNEFADKLVEQVIAQGADIDMKTVTGIKDCGDFKQVITSSGTLEAKAVIIANGVKHRKTGIANENNLVGNGISYCAVCDGAFFRNKKVAVLGGGNSALQEAVLLSENCSEVIIIQNLSFLTGEDKLIAKVNDRANISVITDTVLDDIIGETELESLKLKNVNTGEISTLTVDGLFVAIGLEADNEAFASVAELDGNGYFNTDETCITKTPGVFTAGDCRKKTIRQITTAAADGACAALAACRYLD